MKLIRALRHPEALTAVRAASLLGKLQAREAIPELVERYRAGVDPYFAAAIARALVDIDGEEAQAALRVLAKDPSVIVRNATRSKGEE